MRPRGNLGHDTTKGRMQGGLALHNVGQDLAPALIDSAEGRRQNRHSCFLCRGSASACSFRCVHTRGEVTPMIVTDNAPIPLLMTRPLAQARAFVADLPASLADHLIPVFNPLIEIVPLKPDLLLAPDEQVVFSSANGVACAPDGDGRRAYCIGQVTTEAACARGWDAQTAGQTSAELIETLAQAGIDSPLVHLAGRHTRGNIAENLGKTGLTVRYVALYDQELTTNFERG